MVDNEAKREMMDWEPREGVIGIVPYICIMPNLLSTLISHSSRI